MRLPAVHKHIPPALSRSNRDDKHLVVPGDIITSDTGFMRYKSVLILGNTALYRDQHGDHPGHV